MLPWQPFLAFYIWGAHWRHLKNTTEPSMCGGHAALCQITLTTCCPSDSHISHLHTINGIDTIVSILLWPPCVADAGIIFCHVVSSFFFFLSSPNLHGVALVRI